MYKKVLLLLLFTKMAIAGPWMTGPLLAPAGKTVPRGHVNFEPYGFYTDYQGGFKNIEAVPVLTLGLTDFMDIQGSIPLDYSWFHGQHDGGLGDFSLALGFQLHRQTDHGFWPDVRFVIQEVFPTGRFEELDPDENGVDQTGTGAYQTYLGLNFQKLTALKNDHWLRTRLGLLAVFPSDISVHGVNTFGGTTTTEGIIHPGNSFSADLAFEYALTQHWVPVFEVLYVNSNAFNFNGNPGFTPGGSMAAIGGSGGNQVSLAPALEYNYNANLGIIGGLWFSVTGPHSSKFVTAALAINYYL